MTVFPVLMRRKILPGREKRAGKKRKRTGKMINERSRKY
jgi:hypothetical protein